MAGFWKKRWWRIMVGGALGLAGLFVFLAAVMPKLGVQKQLQRIREAGFPSTPEEWNAWYEVVPDEENAALLIEEAIDLHVDDEVSRLEMLLKDETAAAEAKEVRASYLAANRATIQKLHEAAELPRSRYPIELSPNLLSAELDLNEIRHWRQVRYLVFLLNQEAIAQAEQGNGQEATRALITGFQVGRTLRGEPHVTPEVSRLSATRKSLGSLQEVFNEQELERSELERLMKILEETGMEREGSLVRAIAGERLFQMMQFEERRKDAFRFSFREVPWSEDNRMAIRDLFQQQKDLSAYIDVTSAYLRTLTNDYPEVLQISREVERAGRNKLKESWFAGTAGIATLVRLEAYLRAELRCARVAVALEMYRQDHGGDLPPSLEELTPEYLEMVPFNPLDGEPVEYERTGAGYRIAAPIPEALRPRPRRQEAFEMRVERKDSLNN